MFFLCAAAFKLIVLCACAPNIQISCQLPATYLHFFSSLLVIRVFMALCVRCVVFPASFHDVSGSFIILFPDVGVVWVLLSPAATRLRGVGGCVCVRAHVNGALWLSGFPPTGFKWPCALKTLLLPLSCPPSLPYTPFSTGQKYRFLSAFGGDANDFWTLFKPC